MLTLNAFFNNSSVNKPQHMLFSLTNIEFDSFHNFLSPKLLLPPTQHIY